MGARHATNKPGPKKDLPRRPAARSVKQKPSVHEELRRARADAVEARAQQAATAEILKVISSSPTDTQPVFDAIVTSAARLLPSTTNTLFFRDGDSLHLGAYAGPLAVGVRKTLNGMYPVPFDSKTSPAAIAILEGRVP